MGIPNKYHYIRGIWGLLLRVPSQGYHHSPYDTLQGTIPCPFPSFGSFEDDDFPAGTLFGWICLLVPSKGNGVYQNDHGIEFQNFIDKN